MVLKRKQKIAFTVLLLITMCLLTNCYFKSPWTTEEKKQFENECLSTTTIDYLGIELKGFADEDFDSILVKEFNDNLVLDSFKVAIRKAGTPDEKSNKIRWASINRIFNLKYLYKFIIPGQEPYELTNMKMAVTDEYTMQGEGHGCRLDQFTINGKTSERGVTMTFEKKQKLN